MKSIAITSGDRLNIQKDIQLRNSSFPPQIICLLTKLGFGAGISSQL